jgi:NodT family efflux transporter outer membrane factor (OMF) lipoprotein
VTRALKTSHSLDKAACALALVCVVGVALSSCAVGPDFETPPAPPVEHFFPEKAASPGNGQYFVEDAEVPARWWTAFHSRNLDHLIDEAIAHNPSLDAADAAIRVAEANRDAVSGGFFPQISLNSNSAYNFPSGDSTSSTVTQTAFSYFTKQVQVGYVPDIWGANRRMVESLDAQRESQVHQRQAAYTLLAANVVKAAIEEASLRAQIIATQRIIELEEERIALLNRQHAYGAVAGTDIDLQQAELARARQALPALESRRARQRNLLTTLAGRYPSEEIGETFELSRLAAPRDLPVILPAQLVAQRPDIKAAEANVHSASAQIGVAVAARLPNIVLTANGGSSAFQLAQLFVPGTWSYNMLGNVAQPVFDGMKLLNQQRAAEAGLDEARAQYSNVVLKAFQDVADTLRALQSDAKAVALSRAAESSSRKYLEKIRAQHSYGGASQLAVVDAQRTYLNSSIARIQAEAQRLADTIALFVALGGGWKKGDDAASRER